MACASKRRGVTASVSDIDVINQPDSGGGASGVATQDLAALLPPHLAIFRQICRLALTAYARYGLDFPDRIEEEMTDFYHREWPSTGRAGVDR